MNFNAELATQAYIDGLGEEALAQASAYTSGNQWLMLWSLFVAIVSTWLIIRSGLLTRLSNKLVNKSLFSRSFQISASFIVISAIIELPWTIYTGLVQTNFLRYDVAAARRLSEPVRYRACNQRHNAGLTPSSVLLGN